MRTTLQKQKCRECKCETLVAPYQPHPDEEYVTGWPATRWDSDRMEDYFVGWICSDCAIARVGEGLTGAISGPSLTFHYGAGQ